MKKVGKSILATILVVMCSVTYSQIPQNSSYQWELPIQANETMVGTISLNVPAGEKIFWWDGDVWDSTDDYKKNDVQLYELLYQNAQSKYGEAYPQFILRSMRVVFDFKKEKMSGNTDSYKYIFSYSLSAIVVVKQGDEKEQATNENISAVLSRVMDKALQNVREGSRLAVDIITASSGSKMNREELKDQVIDHLLDKGFKVVAKEYMEKLYEEQGSQQSGIYNEKTTVKENNFSAVGYYINVKLTETLLRVQVINVSTGEYEGNTTINL